MKGPFLSERGINLSNLPYSSTRRSFTHCARRNFRNPRTGPGTRCDSGQNGQTNRVPCMFGILSTITAHPALHSRKKTCGAGSSFDTGFPSLTAAAALRGAALRALAGRRLELDRDVRDAVINPFPDRTGEICLPSPTIPYGLRRSTIIFDCERFLRVLAPNVGKPQGVCGWLPFTRPSPPPCG